MRGCEERRGPRGGGGMKEMMAFGGAHGVENDKTWKRVANVSF